MANQRENFESAIMRSLYGQMGTPEELFRRDADGDCYIHSMIQSAWWGYQVGGAAVRRELESATLQDAGDRQLVLLALANLALLRPGFDHALRTLATRFDMLGEVLFEQFKVSNRDLVGGFVYPPAGLERILPVRRAESAGEESKKGQHPAYLGDGVYASFDGAQVWLMTDNDNGLNKIALDVRPFASLMSYHAHLVLMQQQAQATAGQEQQA